MLEKVTKITSREFLEDGTLRVQRDTVVLEDGVPIAEAQHSISTYPPGSDVAHEHSRVKSLAQTEWTPEVLATYRAAQARRQPGKP